MGKAATTATDDNQASAPAPAAALPKQAGRPAAVTVPNERHGNQNQPAARALLMQVCERLGINPDVNTKPVELLTWTYYRGDELNQIPDAVSVVTAGGRKLKLYADDSVDDDTVAMLARVFKIAPHPDGSPWQAIELPEDLTLPTVEVTGMSLEAGHVYRKGYLKEGGKAEAARRQSLKKAGSKA